MPDLAIGNLAGRDPEAGEESDEYEDDEDPGYVREEIRCQDAFASRELDASDEDGSGRGEDVYHRALAFQGQARPLIASCASLFPLVPIFAR